MTTSLTAVADVPAGGRRDHAIGNFHITWSATAAPEPERLQRLTDLLVTDALEDALSDLGFGADDLVCIRRVAAAPHRVRWTDSDEALVRGWSRSIAVAVEAAMRAPGDARVVRYRSRAHAVVDLVIRSAAGDLVRAWAWSQLGLWPTAAPYDRQRARDAVTRLLTAYPALVPWALVATCRAGQLTSLRDLLGPGRLASLLRGVWAGAGGFEFPETGSPGGFWLPETGSPGGRAPVSGASIVARSEVARAILGAGGLAAVAGRSGGGDAPAAAVALAVGLAAACVLEAEPSLAPLRAGVATVADVARLLWPGDGPILQGPASPVGPELPDARMPGNRVGAESTPRSLGEVAGLAPGRPEMPVDARTGLGVREPLPVPPATLPRTAWGGLLFLLHLLDGPALARAAEERPGWGGLRVFLHAMGRDLLIRGVPDAPAPDPADPALLAFAGLAVPPAGEPGQAGSLALLASEASRASEGLLEDLRARLRPGPFAEVPETALLLAVCRRAATVIVDPGWTDVVLDLDEVSVDVRRAGLDLDLGFLPWLGCVVRFRYA